MCGSPWKSTGNPWLQRFWSSLTTATLADLLNIPSVSKAISVIILQLLSSKKYYDNIIIMAFLKKDTELYKLHNYKHTIWCIKKFNALSHYWWYRIAIIIFFNKSKACSKLSGTNWCCHRTLRWTGW